MKWLKIFLLIIMLESLIFIISCARAPHLKPGYLPPQEIVERYHSALRWRNYESARQYVLPELYPDFDRFIQSIKDTLNISDFQIISLKLEEGGYQAQVQVRRNYYLLNSLKNQEETLTQTWKLVNGMWYLSAPPF